jgi:transposase
MNIHKNARLTPLRREEMALAVIEGNLSQAQAASQYTVTAKIVKRWVERYKEQGRAGMADRSSRPKCSPNATGQAVADRIVALRLRRRRFPGKHIASTLAISPATVSRVLARAGLSPLKDLEPAEPVRRYERDEPGDMIHIDIKKLNRFNEPGHRVNKDRAGGRNKHIRTKPYTPKTNGKAERFIQTALREWAYAAAYPTSKHRTAELPVWMHRCNWHRPHGSLKSKTPISRLGLTRDNLLRFHS